MHGVRLGIALGLLLASQASAQTKHLLYSAPCAEMRVWRDWDPDLADSVTRMDCEPGLPLRDLVKIVLWKQPISGGPAAQTDSHWVQPCFPDSFMFQGPGHYHLRASNAAGQGCASGVVTIMPSNVTGSDVVVVQDPVLTATLYNVHGRVVAVFPGQVWYESSRLNWAITPDMLARGVARGRLPSGVYFLRGTTRGKATRTQRVVLVR